MKLLTRRNLFILILLFGLTGLYASFNLTIDKIALLKNADLILPCNINPILSCTSVMNTQFSEISGIPNSLFGIVGYTIMITIAVFILLDGKASRKFMIFANLGALGAFIFSYGLLFISIFIIKTLCPYCLISCISATNLFFLFTLMNLNDNNFGIKGKGKKLVQTFLEKKYYIGVIIIWYLLIIALIAIRFPAILTPAIFEGF